MQYIKQFINITAYLIIYYQGCKLDQINNKSLISLRNQLNISYIHFSFR